MEKFSNRVFKRKKLTQLSNRRVYIRGQIPSAAEDNELYAKQKFCDNKIVSYKYTVWNFIPKNLFEQFRRVASFYFLCIAIVQMFIDSPVNPATTWLPLVFVIVVTAIKQGYEDWLRHRSDREVNLRPVNIIQDNQIKEIKSKDLLVGSIVRVERDEGFPCDLVVISSSNPEGKCLITTANLDGETNLKIRYCPKETRHLTNPEELSQLIGYIDCQNPNADLYRFTGTLAVIDQSTPDSLSKASLGIDNVLLRGSRLKDTEFIYGCVVYSGPDTKMSLNSKITSNKFSTVEKTMNAFLLFFLGILIFEIALCTGLKYGFEAAYSSGNGTYSIWYLDFSEVTAQGVFNDIVGFLVIFSYIIPISLYVTLEIQKFLGSLFFNWDREIYCPVNEEPAICNSSDLNEELGQVQFLFTDKTGTLTENSMYFRECSISGRKYREREGVLLSLEQEDARNLNPVQNFAPDMEEFFVTLALCHTVHLSKPTTTSNSDGTSEYSNSVFSIDIFDYEYQASSPDEKALVEACRRVGVVYHGEEDDVCRLSVFGEERSYRRLQVLEFDSDRKRMSVIMQYPDGSFYLLCKGAESTVIPRCVEGSHEETLKHVNDYAMLGLRTLAIAVRRLTATEYNRLTEDLNQARQSLVEREKKVSEVFDAFESNMSLLGATGVEDQLQDGVEETLEALRAAGIKVWVLTGDKMETAVNIAYSCGHFKRGTVLLELVGQSSVAQCQEILWRLMRKIWDEPMKSYGLIIDGQSLIHALDAECRKLLADVAHPCMAVVCCRMSPIQKAEVVKLVKRFPEKPITAAIGDGANDVSMIQEAHVGLGIMGKEGRQAVRCADFAFGRFKFLRRVLLVHGHWYYWRVSALVQYFFYKNVAFITPTLFFVFFNGFSSQPIYDSYFLTFYNILFTSLPILVYGLFEQNFSGDQLMRNSHLYKEIRGDSCMSWAHFAKWNLLGLWHAIVVYFGCMLIWGSDVAFVSSGQTLDYWSFGTLCYHTVVAIVNIKLLIESRYWSAFFVFSVLLSVFGFIGITLLYSAVNIEFLGNWPFIWVYFNLLSTGPAWMGSLLLFVVGLTPDLLIAVWETYSVGGGILVNQTTTPAERVRMKLDRTFSWLVATKRQNNVNLHQSNGSWLEMNPARTEKLI